MALVRIRTNLDGEHVQFRPDAAASFVRIERWLGRQADVNRTVVPYDVQMDLYEKRQRGEYPYTVAHPRYSDHVYRSDTDGGNAWDTDERGDWLDDNGWIADVEGEPWHRRYVPSRDKYRTSPAPASAGRPATINTIPLEEDDMIALRIKDYDGNKHLCTLGNGVFRHLIAEDDPERIKNIVRSDDAWTDTDLVELPRLLKTYGCRGAIWRCEKGVFTVLDSVETQNAGREVLMQGGMWSAALSR